MYRPQFAYPTPEGCEDQRCHYSFDGSNTPSLVGNLGAGLSTPKIPLLLDSDADFFLRAIQLQPGLGLQIRLEDGDGNPLSDSGNIAVAAGIQKQNYVDPALYGEPDGAGIVALESDEQGVYFRRAGGLSLYVTNPTAAPISLANIVVNLHGVKRYSGEKCT